MNIVLVEDHDVLRKLLQEALEDAGHNVVALSCSEELEDVAGGQQVDVFLIDLNLPGEDGLSLTERVRSTYPLVGIVLITARSALNDRLDGYARGADLYMSKPFDVLELCAAVTAIGRRRQREASIRQQTHSDLFTLHQQQMRISRSGYDSILLSAAEMSILIAFSRAPGQRLAYWQLAETLGLDLENYPKASLEVRIVRLRKKIVEAGGPVSCIEAARNFGYQLCIPIQVV